MHNISVESPSRLFSRNFYFISRLEKLTTTIQDAGIFSGQLILIEKRGPDGAWPL